MPTILLPIDFSETSLNAARYAAKFAQSIGDAEILLFNAYQDQLIGADGTPISSNVDLMANRLVQELENLQVLLYEISSVPTSISVMPGELHQILPDFVLENNIDLVVMGITGANVFDQLFGSSNVLELIRKSDTPVLVVPPKAKYTEINDVALVAELYNTAGLIPFTAMKKWLQLLKARVHVANVKNGIIQEMTELDQEELVVISNTLKEFHPKVHMLPNQNFSEAVDHFAQKNSIELLITFPQKHGFFDLLFNGSKTKDLIFHSTTPVLTMHHPYDN